MTKKIWLYNTDTKKFIRLSIDDPRLDWNNTKRYAPIGHVRYNKRKSFWYYPFGETKQEAADNANKNTINTINKLQTQINDLKNILVVVDK